MNDEKRVVECANWTQWKWEIYKLLWFVNVCCYCEEVNSLHSVYLQIFILYQQQDQASNHHKFQTNNTTWVLSQLTNSKLTFHPPNLNNNIPHGGISIVKSWSDWWRFADRRPEPAGSSRQHIFRVVLRTRQYHGPGPTLVCRDTDSWCPCLILDGYLV